MLTFYKIILLLQRLPTKITTQSSTIIDNILMSSFDSKIYTGNLLVGLSDHCPQLAIIWNGYEMKENVKQSIFIQDWKKFDECKFKSDFRSIDWDKIIENQESSDLAFRRFHRKVLEIIDKSVPRIILTKKQKKREHKPWITKEIIKTINTRDKMLHKFYKEKSPLLRDDLFQKYKSYRNRLVGIISDSKNQHYISYFNENFRTSKKL